VEKGGDNMKYHYFLVVSSVKAEDGNEVLTYGICGNGIKFKDVSTDEQAVADLVKRMNEAGDVEPCQVQYLVENLVEELA